MFTASYLTRTQHRLLPIYVTTAGHAHLQEKRVRPNGAPFHHIFYIEEGEGVFLTRDNCYVLKKNSVLFIKKETPITYYANSENFQTAWVTFNGRGVSDILRYFAAEDFSFREGISLYPRLLSCIGLCDRGDTTAEQLSCAVYDLLVAYFSLQKKSSPPSLALAKNLMEEKYAENLSIADLALAAGVSQSVLFRLFREHENCTPNEFLRDVRIQNAKTLLLSDSQRSIGEIARDCGFSSVAYFCKTFKSVADMTPNKYREIYGI